MVKNCCVKNCPFKKRPKDKMSFHMFPTTNAVLLQKWIDFLEYGDDWKPTKYLTICSAHFLPTDFQVNTNLSRLKANVIPTIKFINENDNKNNTNIDLEIIPSEDIILEATGDINKTCRLCGNEFRSDLKHIFEKDDVFALRIQKCFQLLISKNDVLPLSVCQYCEINLEKFEQLISKIEQTQKVLIKRFCSVNMSEAVTERSYNDEQNYDNMTIMESDSDTAKPLEIESSDKVIISNANTNFNKRNLIMKSLIINEGNPIPNYQTATISSKHNFAYQNVSSFTPTHKMLHLEDVPFRIPIKKELMTPCADKEIKATTSSRNINKKIEILEDIKIDPIQIDFKSFKPRQEENVLNIQNVNPQPQIVKEKPIAKVVNTNKSNTISTILSNSTVICKFCDEKFISKYALNNHVKYLCEKKCNTEIKKTTKCNMCKKAHKANHKHLCKKKISLLKVNVS